MAHSAEKSLGAWERCFVPTSPSQHIGVRGVRDRRRFVAAPESRTATVLTTSKSLLHKRYELPRSRYPLFTETDTGPS
jgi:hypothetical protein